MTLPEILGLFVFAAALIALRATEPRQQGGPSRRQRREWAKWRLEQPQWNRRTR